MSKPIRPEVLKLLSRGAIPDQQKDRYREVGIASTGDLVRIVECEHRGSSQYRGQGCATWCLLPKLTRPGGPVDLGLDKKKGESWVQKEQHILSEFRTRAPRYEHGRDLTAVGDLELSIWDQHHGAPTRLLDWTLNPLAALYFAVEDEEKDCHDAAVWAIAQHRDLLGASSKDPLPPPECGVRFIIPPRFFHRSAVQASILAVWGDPCQPLEEIIVGNENLWKIVVPKDKRDCIRWSLHCLGIDRETLFPDMDGLGQYLSWKHRRIHQYNYEEHCIPVASCNSNET